MRKKLKAKKNEYTKNLFSFSFIPEFAQSHPVFHLFSPQNTDMYNIIDN